nr:MAG TPA: hypothetical protein [Caudoviricetes sp.]
MQISDWGVRQMYNIIVKLLLRRLLRRIQPPRHYKARKRRKKDAQDRDRRRGRSTVDKQLIFQRAIGGRTNGIIGERLTADFADH